MQQFNVNNNCNGSGDNNNLSSPNVVEEKKVSKKNEELKSGKKLFVSDFCFIFFD